MALSVRRRGIIDPGRFLVGGLPSERRGSRGLVPPAGKRGDRVVLPMQDHYPSTVMLPLSRTSPEARFQGVIWQQYDRLAKLCRCK